MGPDRGADNKTSGIAGDIDNSELVCWSFGLIAMMGMVDYYDNFVSCGMAGSDVEVQFSP